MFSADGQIATVVPTRRRFAVAWRNRNLRERFPVGALDHVDDGVDPIYRFQYLPDVNETAEGFRPFVGFPDLQAVYESPRLWPFFSLRVMDRKRGDFSEYVHWLGLNVDASPLDILSRSGGEQKGDTVLLTEAPAISSDGYTTAVFLVRGASYAVRHFGTDAVVRSLCGGDPLLVLDDVGNEANPDALLLTSSSGSPIGWVPDLLIDYLREIRAGDGSIELLQNNGPEAPWHTRLLVAVAGHVSPATKVFSGGRWPALLP